MKLTFFTLIALIGCLNSAFAERYLTLDAARKLCFPNADRFEEQTVRFTPEQRKSIEQRCGSPMRNLGNRLQVAFQGTNLLGVIMMDHVMAKREIIDYAVAIKPPGEVAQVEILEYRESHGMEIRNEKWRDQFKGKKAASKLKLNDDIFNISGATISCRHVTEGIKRVLATYDLVVRDLPSVGGRMPDNTKAAHP